MKRVAGITFSLGELYFVERHDVDWKSARVIVYKSKEKAVRELSLALMKLDEIVLGVEQSECDVQQVKVAGQLSEREIGIYLEAKFPQEYYDYKIISKASEYLLHVISVKKALIDDYIALFKPYQSKIKAIDLNVFALKRFKHWVIENNFNPSVPDIYLFTAYGLSLWNEDAH